MNMAMLNRLLAPLQRGMRQIVNRAVLQSINDAGGLQELQVQALADEVLDRVERFQEYGLTSVPLAGAEGLVLSVCGSRSNAVIIAVDDRRYRIKLEAGEVALYTDEGDYVALKRGHLVETSCQVFRVKATVGVEFGTPTFGMSHNGGAATATITGSVATTGDVVAGAVSLKGHVHPENDSGGPTSPPVGG